MPSSDPTSRLVPDVKIRVDGVDIPQDAAADVIGVTVQDDIYHPSSFSLKLDNWDPQKIDMKWSDDDLFKVGKEVEVRMGYVGSVITLIHGEITGLELGISPSQTPWLIVRGYDRGHRLTRGHQTMSYTNMTDSDIASQIASNHGLSVEAEKTDETYQYLLQHNQTDAEFLRHRARRIGYEVFVREKKLVFRARKNTASESAVISVEQGLLEFNPRLSTMQQTAKVVIRGWNMMGKEAWVGQAQTSDETGTMAGQTTGLQAATDAFGDAAFTSGVQSVVSQADADQRARGRLKEMAIAYICADGRSVGRPELLAGTVAKVEGMGKRFSGLYYLTTTTHSYAPAVGYRTAFQARRNAS